MYLIAELLAIAKEVTLGDSENLARYLEIMEQTHPIARHYGDYGLGDANRIIKDAIKLWPKRRPVD